MKLIRLRWLAPLALLLALLVPASTLATSYAAVVSHGSRAVKVVALTFDDGWGTANCAKIVNILEATKTPATFLPNAKWVAAAPTFWRHVAALGFPLANHTYNHPDLTRLSYAAQFKEINSDRLAIEKITGKPMVRMLRPPFGAYNTTTRAAAAAAGFPTLLMWDTSFADSSRRPNGGLWPLSAYLKAATKGTDGSVILGHCGSPVDYQILKSVIASYEARGFKFVTIPQLFHLPGAKAMTF
jgi:peptidoglycan/xylan/chitin deacetylase (PgdA/CDA1 family)